MLRRITLFISLSFLLLSENASARNESVMVVAEHMPPFQIITDNPKHLIEGYSIDVLRTTLKQAHIDYSIMPMAWERAYNLGQKKPNTIILSMVKKPEREKTFHWLIKLSDSKTSIWSYPSNQKKISSLADITDEIIAVTRNDHHQLILKNYANLTEKNFIYTSSKEQAIALVMKHRAQYFLGNDFILNWRLKLAHLEQDDIVEVFQLPQVANGLYIAASRETSPRIRNKIKKAYAKLQVNGEIKTIADKWFKP
ncbi:substrate-binding periplasmic protein [Cognaticolwellia mytili]|uniref:substrate-binding periplasmic protein n=1 Tax=Cognaticolwellia mytili TaxID=1888913 RepID=UPI000A16F943|nr:ABC transporter substrate-binding protein [Cognaticolwellia mytili]